MTYCRFCGAPLVPDSVFCSKCGRRLGHAENPRLDKIVRTLRLRTPYPYAAVLLVLAAAWLWTPAKPPFDYSKLTWTVEPTRKLDIPEENLFQQGFSLVLQNTRDTNVKDVPVEIRASIEPAQPAEIMANFLGQRMLIMGAGRPLPLVVVLTDEVQPGAKRTYSIEGSIQAMPPFKVTYQIQEEESGKVLASYTVQR